MKLVMRNEGVGELDRGSARQDLGAIDLQRVVGPKELITEKEVEAAIAVAVKHDFGKGLGAKDIVVVTASRKRSLDNTGKRNQECRRIVVALRVVKGAQQVSKI